MKDIAEEAIAKDRNVEFAIVTSFSVHGFKQMNGKNKHLGSGFAIILLNKKSLDLEIVDILVLSISEGRSGYSYPDDF